jgi:FMN reductase
MPDPEPISVVAISGSLRRDSITFFAVRNALEACAAAGARTEMIDLRSPEWMLPFCDARDEEEQAHEPVVARLRERVGGACALILGSPEYHGSVSGVLKNALDLMSSEQFKGKMVGLVSVAGGAHGAGSLSHLRLIMRAVHAWVVPQQVMVPYAGKAFDAAGKPNDPKLLKRFQELGAEVVKYAAIHRAAGMPPYAPG